MTAKQYLNQARGLDKRINAKLEEVSRLEALATKVTAANTERVQVSQEDKRSKQIDRLVDLKDEINEEIDRLVDLKADISGRINQMEDNCQVTLLTMRYLNMNTWEEIAEEMGYEERTVRRNHERALEAFERLMR